MAGERLIVERLSVSIHVMMCPYYYRSTSWVEAGRKTEKLLLELQAEEIADWT